MRRGTHELRKQLRGTRDVFVLVAPGTDPASLRGAGFSSAAEVHDLTAPVPRVRDRDAVVLVVRDLVSLRRAATGVPNVGAARQVAVWFERAVATVPALTPRPNWPAVDRLVASRSPDPFVLVCFASTVQARQVLLELARAAAPSGRLAVGWPSLGVRRDEPSRWPPADPSAKVAMLPGLLDQSVESPPDLAWLGRRDGADPGVPEDEHPGLGRPSRVALAEPELTWEQWTALSPADAAGALAARGPSSLGAVDEQLINPMNFDREPPEGTARLTGGRGSALHLVTDGGRPTATIDADCGLSDVDLPSLRAVAAVRLDWSGGRGPQHYCRTVAGLAMAGVPLLAEQVPDWARHLLAPGLVGALEERVDVGDRLRREEHSVRLRRAALRAHGAAAWRRRLAESQGLQQSADPTVSVLLPTRRPEMLPFALRQVARQRGVDLELVLAAHGFDPDPAELAVFREACGAPLTVVRVDASESFGAVLNHAASRAGGDLLVKMDDDDWYGPDFVGDLQLAASYSGAELVGCPPEFTFLQPLWLTARGTMDSERYRPFVAGGTILVERGAFRAVGGFRHTARSVDAHLLSAVLSAGGRIYRTQGLGYVLRRGTAGHTWDPGLAYFLTPERVRDQWRGFRPSALLELAPVDLPTRPTDSIEAR